MSESRGTPMDPHESTSGGRPTDPSADPPVDPSAVTVPSSDLSDETACEATAFGVRSPLRSGSPGNRSGGHFGSRAGAEAGPGRPVGYGAGSGMPPSPYASERSREAIRREAPSHVGKYELIRRIADGGMGSVYLGRDTTLQQRRLVAVKLVRQGFVSRESRARFDREIRVLAGLDHPCVARFLGHGEVDGLPYFVLDYVEGNEIDRYADRHELSVRERLDLFCRICEGIEHVHGNAIIHRDLKPANIMVTEDGTPKILDFGIAKILSDSMGGDDAMLTQGGTGRSPMTPVYASPEQLNGEATDVRTDVYSLGLILYELLTGHRAHDVAGGKTQEIARVRETRPAAPSLRLRTAVTVDSRRGVLSDVPGPDETTKARWPRRRTSSAATRAGATPAVNALADDASARTLSADELARRRRSRPGDLRAELRGDLDRIVLKALDPSPTHRYRSVEALRADIQRHLDGMPIEARPPSRLYVTRKFVRRHRAMVVGSLVGVFGVTSLVAAVMVKQDRQIGDLESVAVTIQEQLRDSYDTLADDLGDRNLPPIVRQEYARLSAEFAGLLEAVDGASPEVLEAAADGFGWASRVSASRVSEDSGDFEAAATYRGQAMEAYDRAFRASATVDRRARTTLGALRMERDGVLARDIAGEAEGARAAGELQAILDRVPSDEGLDEDVQVENLRFRSITSLFLAEQLSELQRPPADPADAFTVAIDANRELVDRIGPPARRNLVTARNKYRTWLTAAGRHDEAVELATAVTSGRRQLAAAAPGDPRARRDLANGLASEAAARMADDAFDAAIVRDRLDEAIAILGPMYDLPGERRKVSLNYAVALVNAGGVSLREPEADRDAEQLLNDLDRLSEAAAVSAAAPQSGASGDVFGLVMNTAASEGRTTFDELLRVRDGGLTPDDQRRLTSIASRFRAANTGGQFSGLLGRLPAAEDAGD